MIYDVYVIGGGINGAGIACEASARGLSTYLCEMNDFASGTSSASSSLIHGGLRYLEQMDFKLVRESLAERTLLLQKAPHLVHPLSFVIPFTQENRSLHFIRLGLWLYDHLAKTTLAKYHKATPAELAGLKPKFVTGLVYNDCQTDDARLVIANILQAESQGAMVKNYCLVKRADVINGTWHIAIVDAKTQQESIIKARCLINATGPWADITARSIQPQMPAKLTLVQGSHIIVNKPYPGYHAFLLQNIDKRVVFTLPFLNDKLIIGTTDELFTGDLSKISITEQEKTYLIATFNHYFNQAITEKDILHSYSGVRPLYASGEKNASRISRDYHLSLMSVSDLPLLTVYGGKLTTYRRLSEKSIDKIAQYFPTIKNKPKKNAPIWGGNFDKSEKLYHALSHKFTFIPESILHRYIRQYGCKTWDMLNGCTKIDDMGEQFSTELYQIELNYLISIEHSYRLDDIIWRRTKLGYQLSQLEKDKVASYLAKVEHK